MPISANKRLAPTKGGGRLRKTEGVRAYDRAIEIWAMNQRWLINDWRKQAKKWIDVGYVIKVDYIFYFLREKVVTKDGFIQRIDKTNRLKDAEDAVSDIIGVDDMYFFDSTVKKRISKTSYEEFTAVLTCIPLPLDETN